MSPTDERRRMLRSARIVLVLLAVWATIPVCSEEQQQRAVAAESSASVSSGSDLSDSSSSSTGSSSSHSSSSSSSSESSQGAEDMSDIAMYVAEIFDQIPTDGAIFFDHRRHPVKKTLRHAAKDSRDFEVVDPPEKQSILGVRHHSVRLRLTQEIHDWSKAHSEIPVVVVIDTEGAASSSGSSHHSSQSASVSESMAGVEPDEFRHTVFVFNTEGDQLHPVPKDEDWPEIIDDTAYFPEKFSAGGGGGGGGGKGNKDSHGSEGKGKDKGKKAKKNKKKQASQSDGGDAGSGSA